MRGASFRASNTQQGLTENMQILTGQKGDRLDKALTLREAAELGMVNLRRNGAGQIVPELPPDKPTDPEWSGVQQPVAPTGVTADGAFHTITLTWGTPAYKGHSYAEILRAEVDNPSKAVSIGTTLANVYSDAVGKGFSAFYWVRFVNKNGMVGPYHSSIGLHAETSKDIQDIINELDGKIKISHFDKWLKQDYEGVKETATSLKDGVGSMWAVKASASQINAGIGLVAKSDGTSQVFIAASQVFVYDPNNPDNSTAPLFAIDQGKAVIQEAIIRSATIQIIHSEKITADYIKAGVSISAPLITGGQIDMGNAFMSGGAAGFGKGGPYAAWGWGWYTMIYADGSVYTNRLRAEGGYVRNMAIGNCTIEEDCIVKGTIYAERIVGDVSAIKSLYMQQPSGPFSIFFNVAPANFSRGVIITGINIKAEGYYYGSGGQPLEGTRACSAVFYMNGVEFGRESVSATGGTKKDSATASATITLPAGVRGQFQVSILGDVSVSLVGAVAMVFKHGSATFE
ncbi:DUF1983 domain-containing protein [Aeromonas veronii]|uniref:phage tail tip fiber protein n=1 Tax=Aeromonas veronii TaxID=654 RepID=UPI00222F12F8|nr:DUF1983 domain-containing protein [Aeromonas veronii]UZE61036.1 DUF1983 domain-containing protein [Aeromonas veronii]